MSETQETPVTEKRSIEAINADYNTECARLGEVMFKSMQLQARLASNQQQAEELVKRITALATEAKDVQK